MLSRVVAGLVCGGIALLVGVVLFSLYGRRRSRLRRRQTAIIIYITCVELLCIVGALWLKEVHSYRLPDLVQVIGALHAVFLFGIRGPLRGLLGAKKRVIFIGVSRQDFFRCVGEGLEGALRNAGHPLHLEMSLPEPHEEHCEHFQLECLRSQRVQDSDAVVIFPSRESDALHTALVSLALKGVFIVSMDTKLRNADFYRRGIRMPRFVGSDFRVGGRRLADVIQTEMDDGKTWLIFLLGPRESSPAIVRGQACILELAVRGLMARTISAELTSWDIDDAIAHVKACIERLPRKGCERVIVFCGIDEICLGVDSFLSTPGLGGGRTYLLIGYDGLRHATGELVVKRSSRAIGTIDVVPRRQGTLAGELIVSEYLGRDSEVKNIVVEPVTQRRPTWR